MYNYYAASPISRNLRLPSENIEFVIRCVYVHTRTLRLLIHRSDLRSLVPSVHAVQMKYSTILVSVRVTVAGRIVVGVRIQVRWLVRSTNVNVCAKMYENHSCTRLTAKLQSNTDRNMGEVPQKGAGVNSIKMTAKKATFILRASGECATKTAD